MPELACIFCQRSQPLIKITKEHLFSRWVDEVLTAELLGPDRSFERSIRPAGGEARRRTWPTEVIATIEASVVCGSQQDRPHDGCNDGWMSDLDAQVKKIISPMVLGNPALITPDEQLVIATWAAMKAMVLEYLWGKDSPVVSTQQHRDELYRERRPPESMQIRIAAVESHGRPVLATARVYQQNPTPAAGSTEGRFVICTSFALGCFVVQTFGGPGAIRSPARRPAAPRAGNFIPIFPANERSVSWPPAIALDDEALDRFTHPLQPITGD